MSGHHQYASICAWDDEQHVIDSREIYRHKFKQMQDFIYGPKPQYPTPTLHNNYLPKKISPYYPDNIYPEKQTQLTRVEIIFAWL